MRPRHVHHEPVVPAQGGKPPTFIVRCTFPGCGFAHDAHGRTPEQAIASVRGHQVGHRLRAERQDLTTGYGPQGTDPHPLY